MNLYIPPDPRIADLGQALAGVRAGQEDLARRLEILEGQSVTRRSSGTMIPRAATTGPPEHCSAKCGRGFSPHTTPTPTEGGEAGRRRLAESSPRRHHP